ncbi:amino acid ABC transporter substrate-binding protein [Streptomyces chartreusis]|uniref:amino acid ABC transporter substrate-binding protein n=1 Tax=Streptomyces chartreusis TaxID=1969 RepID=UPI003721E010
MNGSIAVLFFSVSVSSCGIVTEKDSGPITIGVSLPLTGPVAESSKPAYAGYRVWAQQVNKKGGLLGRQVELKVLDDGFDEQKVVSNYEKLIQEDDVDLLLGTFSSKLNLPASSVAERAKMLYIEPSGGAEEIFTRGYDYLFFAQPGTSLNVPDGFVDWLFQLPASQRPRTAAYPTQDDPNTKVALREFQRQLGELGVRNVYSKTYQPDTTDFDGIAQDITAAAPDLVVHGAVTADDGGGLIKALQKWQFNPKMMFQTNAPSLMATYPKAVGEGNADGIFTSVAWSARTNFTDNAKFVDAYTRAYGAPPNDDAANAYTAGQALATAVRNVGSLDQTKLADWLHQNAILTISGALEWDSRGVPRGNLLLAQWQDGRLEIIAPEEEKTVAKPLYSKPSWS